MPVIHERSNSSLYDTIVDRNLQSQWHALGTCVEFALRDLNFTYTPDILFLLHHAASVFLDDSPGRLRTRHCHIQGSEHVPPAPETVHDHVQEFFNYLNTYQRNPTTYFDWHLPAYALWKLTWIHPFNECNGRTARSFCFFIMCVQRGRWIKGEKTIHTLIRENAKPYYKRLQKADRAFASGQVDVSSIEDYLKKLMYQQLLSG